MQATLVDGIIESLRIGVGFIWTAAWAIIVGLIITSLVQVFWWSPRQSKNRGYNVYNCNSATDAG